MRSLRAATAIYCLASAYGLLACSAFAAHAQTLEYAKKITSRINPTDRAINMSVPILDGERAAGDAVIRVDPDDTIWIRKAALADIAARLMSGAIAERIRSLPDKDGLIATRALAAAGIDLTFDPAQVALRLELRAADRAPQDISLRRGATPAGSSVLARPAMMSAYLNVIGGVDHVWGTENREAKTAAHISLQSAARIGSVVIENEGVYDGLVDTRDCPADAVCAYEHEQGFKRRGSRIVYDMPEHAIRWQLGDAYVPTAGLQRINDILGLSVEKSPRKLQPNGYLRPTATNSFLIERPSEIEILVNGALIRRLRLRPGTYNLRDLALVAGNNQVEVRILDETGSQRTVSFNTYFDQSLLAPGATEWSLAGGLPSYYRDGERLYTKDDYVGTGFYRLGLSDRLTGEVNAQADSRTILAGAGVLAGTPWGFMGLQGALSSSDDAGLGYALSASWDMANIRGVSRTWTDGVEAIRLSAEYRSREFRLPGEFLTTASGILYPQFNYWLRLSGSYTVPVGWGVAATLSARYLFANDDPAGVSPNTIKGDRYGVDLTFSGALTSTVNASLTLGYSNESYLRYVSRFAAPEDPEFRVMARLFIRLDAKTHISASHDSLNQQSYASGYRYAGNGVGRWETTVDAVHGADHGDAAIGGAVAYYGNRTEVRVSQNAAYDSLSWRNLATAPDQQRTSLQVGSSIAFADGKIAVGAPIRGQAFAIVHPHETLDGREITVGSTDYVRAKADGWGPAVVTDLPAYSQMSLPVDVPDLPLGYSLGAGTFDVSAPYRGGYALQVGSGNSVTAFGTLYDHGGKPLALLAGIAHPEAEPERQVSVLTNSSGRFAAEGLATGRWIIEMAGMEGPVRYVLDVPKGTDGLLRAGDLRPTGTPPSNGWEVRQ